MYLHGTAGFGATMPYTFVEQMSTVQPRRLKPWKRIAALKRFVTSNISPPSFLFAYTFRSIMFLLVIFPIQILVNACVCLA